MLFGCILTYASGVFDVHCNFTTKRKETVFTLHHNAGPAACGAEFKATEQAKLGKWNNNSNSTTTNLEKCLILDAKSLIKCIENARPGLEFALKDHYIVVV